jgi:hypothetical protein
VAYSLGRLLRGVYFYGFAQCRTPPWKVIAQWYPLEQPLENRGRRFENRRKNIGVETGKCACGATATIQHIITERCLQDKQDITDDAQKECAMHIEQPFMPTEVKEVMKHMNNFSWEGIEVGKEGKERGKQHWNETQIQMAKALQARWTGAVNKGLNDETLRQIILTTSSGFKHTSNTNGLLVNLTIIRWKHAREIIDLHEAYYWMDKLEETTFLTRPHGVGMGLAWGWHGVVGMGLLAWGRTGLGLAQGGMGMGSGSHGVDMGRMGPHGEWGWTYRTQEPREPHHTRPESRAQRAKNGFGCPLRIPELARARPSLRCAPFKYSWGMGGGGPVCCYI